MTRCKYVMQINSSDTFWHILVKYPQVFSISILTLHHNIEDKKQQQYFFDDV